MTERSVTKQKRGVRSVAADRARRGLLTVGFYEMQRNRVIKENETLRRRIQYLESKLAKARALAHQVEAECML